MWIYEITKENGEIRKKIAWKTDAIDAISELPIATVPATITPAKITKAKIKKGK